MYDLCVVLVLIIASVVHTFRRYRILHVAKNDWFPSSWSCLGHRSTIERLWQVMLAAVIHKDSSWPAHDVCGISRSRL